MPGHGAARFNVWIKPKVSSQQTPTPKHVSGFAKHSSAVLRFALWFDCSASCGALCGTLHRGLQRVLLHGEGAKLLLAQAEDSLRPTGTWQPQSSMWAAGTARTCSPSSADGRSPTFLVGDLQMGFLFGRRWSAAAAHVSPPCQSPAQPCRVCRLLPWLGAVVKVFFLFQQLSDRELGLLITKLALKQGQRLCSHRRFGIRLGGMKCFSKKMENVQIGRWGGCAEPGDGDFSATHPSGCVNRGLCGAFCCPSTNKAALKLSSWQEGSELCSQWVLRLRNVCWAACVKALGYPQHHFLLTKAIPWNLSHCLCPDSSCPQCCLAGKGTLTSCS